MLVGHRQLSGEHNFLEKVDIREVVNQSTLISLINVEVGIKVEGGINLWKKLMHNSNTRGMWKKSKESINMEGGIFQNW